MSSEQPEDPRPSATGREPAAETNAATGDANGEASTTVALAAQDKKLSARERCALACKHFNRVCKVLGILTSLANVAMGILIVFTLWDNLSTKMVTVTSSSNGNSKQQPKPEQPQQSMDFFSGAFAVALGLVYCLPSLWFAWAEVNSYWFFRSCRCRRGRARFLRALCNVGTPRRRLAFMTYRLQQMVYHFLMGALVFGAVTVTQTKTAKRSDTALYTASHVLGFANWALVILYFATIGRFRYKPWMAAIDVKEAAEAVRDAEEVLARAKREQLRAANANQEDDGPNGAADADQNDDDPDQNVGENHHGADEEQRGQHPSSSRAAADTTDLERGDAAGRKADVADEATNPFAAVVANEL